jgi:outer membrane immunogenic protein
VSDVGGIVFPGFVTAGVPLIVEPDSIGILPGSSASHTSFLGGGQVGYNWQFNQLVFGLEGDIDGAHLRGGATASGSIVRAAGVQMTTVTQSTDVDWTASLRARLGYSAGRVLLYATGGAAFAHVDANTLVNVTFPLAVPSAGATATTNSVTRTGWTLGAGVEWAFRDGWSIAGEYRHSDYGRIDTAFALPVFPTFGFVQATALSSVRLTTDQLTARLNYRFGGP